MRETKINSRFTRPQWISIFGAVILFCILYFGFSTKSPEQKKTELVRAQNFEVTSVQNLLNEAGERLSAEDRAVLHALEAELNGAADDSLKMSVYESLSGFWFDQKEYAIAGHFAEEIAQMLNTGEAWGIAGTTYALALQREQGDERRNFSFNKAVNAFESAISLDPENVSHQLNLALCYTELPPQENPMQGIQMLLKLQEDQPEYIGVKFALARLAIKTGQYERALERLEQASAIDPDDRRIPCLKAEVYRAMGNTAEAEKNEFDCLN